MIGVGLADDEACQQAAVASLVNGVHVGKCPGGQQAQSQLNVATATASHLSRFQNVRDGPSASHEFYQSYVNETRLQRPGFNVTSRMTSSHVTSGSGPPSPVSAVDTPVKSQVTLVPVLVGPSVDRSWETLRTDSTRASVVPHKITSRGSVSTIGPQDETARRSVVVLAAQNANNVGRHGVSSWYSSNATHNAADDHIVRCQSSHGEAEWFDVVVIKSGLTLGFSIDGGRDSLVGDRPISVKRVFTGKQILRVEQTERRLTVILLCLHFCKYGLFFVIALDAEFLCSLLVASAKLLVLSLQKT